MALPAKPRSALRLTLAKAMKECAVSSDESREEI